MNLKLSAHGLQLLKSFEGCRLTAYWDVKGYSIGYGHFGVPAGTKITQAQADEMLVNDVKKYENAVNGLGYELTQGQYDALVDFAYNCGIGNLNSLTNNGRRTLDVVGMKIPLYNKAGGVVNKGLVRRRAAELQMFNSNIATVNSTECYPAYTGAETTIIKVLKDMGVDSSYNYRKSIALCNNITDYKGSAEQNKQLVALARSGQLRRC